MMSNLLISVALVAFLLANSTDAAEASLASYVSSFGITVVGASGSQTGTAVRMIGDYNKDGMH